MKSIYIYLSFDEFKAMKSMQGLQKHLAQRAYDNMFKLFWTGILVKNHVAALDIRSVDPDEDNQYAMNIIYVPKSKSDFIN